MSFKKIKNFGKKVRLLARANSRENREKADHFFNTVCDRLHKMGYRAKTVKGHARYWWEWKIDTDADDNAKNTIIEGLTGHEKPGIDDIIGGD